MPRMKQRCLYDRRNRKLDRLLAEDFQRGRSRKPNIETRGEYRGVRRRLRGKTAIVQVFPWGVMVQFDDLRVKEAYSWWWFPRRDWILE